MTSTGRMAGQSVLKLAATGIAGMGLMVCLGLPLQAQGTNPLLQAAPKRDEFIIERTLKMPRGRVFAAEFSPNQKVIMTLGGNFTIRLWNTESGQMVKTIPTLKHRAVKAIFHPQSGVVFTGGMDTTVRAWDLAKANTPAILKGQSTSITALVTD